MGLRADVGKVPVLRATAALRCGDDSATLGTVRSAEFDEAGRWSSEELPLRAAWFYYKDELTQDEIARRLSLSRASVGRLLDRARRVGLVTINLNAEYLNAFELSAEPKALVTWTV